MQQMPDPSRLVDVLTAYWRSATLVAAIDLGVFDAVSRGARTPTTIGRACHANVRAITRLCDALVAEGWLRVDRDGYRVTASTAALLGSAQGTGMAGIRHFFNAPPVSTGFAELAATVRRGRAGQRSADWVRFAEGALPLRRHVARPVAAALQTRGLAGGRILDIGAGASPLGVTLLRRNRAATLTAIDAAPVLRAARRHARDTGVLSRFTALAGDARAVTWPDADLVLMANVLDYFAPPDQSRLLRKARRSLSSGGTLAIVAPMLDQRRRSPAHAVAYDLMLLAIGGAASTAMEMRKRILRAGFRRVTWLRDADVMLASM